MFEDTRWSPWSTCFVRWCCWSLESINKISNSLFHSSTCHLCIRLQLAWAGLRPGATIRKQLCQDGTWTFLLKICAIKYIHSIIHNINVSNYILEIKPFSYYLNVRFMLEPSMFFGSSALLNVQYLQYLKWWQATLIDVDVKGKRSPSRHGPCKDDIPRGWDEGSCPQGSKEVVPCQSKYTLVDKDWV